MKWNPGPSALYLVSLLTKNRYGSFNNKSQILLSVLSKSTFFYPWNLKDMFSVTDSQLCTSTVTHFAFTCCWVNVRLCTEQRKSLCEVVLCEMAPVRTECVYCTCVFAWAVTSFCHLCAGMNDSDVNQNKNRSNTSKTAPGPAPNAPPRANQGGGYWPRPHLVRLFSRDAPGREDNTFKERPSESDELHTIEEAGGATSENAEWKQPTRLVHSLLSLFNTQHVIFRLSGTVRLQTWAREEKPWSDGSDWKNLWRG